MIVYVVLRAGNARSILEVSFFMPECVDKLTARLTSAYDIRHEVSLCLRRFLPSSELAAQSLGAA